MRCISFFDFEYYNQTRSLIGQNEVTLAEYISRKVSGKAVDEHGLTLDDETSIFSVDPIKLDLNNYMSAKE